MTPTEIEAALRMLFAEVLAIPSVGRDDDFLALGGDSPMALQVDFEAETRFGFRCPPALLLEHPTAAALAPLLSESGGYEPLVPLRPAGGAARPALFCVHVHPGGGHALAYRHLAAAIDPGVPV